ncbi:7351_t:CDS:1, partial [Scutellospora calospora]
NYNEYNNLSNENILPESVPFSPLNNSESDTENQDNGSENNLNY